jgi:hypothetical protein
MVTVIFTKHRDNKQSLNKPTSDTLSSLFASSVGNVVAVTQARSVTSAVVLNGAIHVSLRAACYQNVVLCVPAEGCGPHVLVVLRHIV